MPYDVFISYSSHDKTAADAACAALEASGIRCWIAPRDVTPGAEWGEAIIAAINQCRVMVLIFSAHANDSPQIRREVERAVSKGVSIIPLRIEEIAPTRSLEYFIGTVHWLDALTPPLETHLRRLAESVRALLQVDATPPRIAATTPAAKTPAAAAPRRVHAAMLTAIAALVAAAAAGLGAWWFMGARTAPPPAVSAAQPSISQPPARPTTNATFDPALIGTFELDTVRDDYDWRFVFVIGGDGAYHLITTQDESGTFQAGNGKYRTVASKTGRVRQGTYRAAGSAAIEVTSALGAAVYRPTQQTAPVNPANPVMLGVWTSTVVLGGVTWTLTIQNNPDRTYHYQARAEDNGTCMFANQQWRTTSAVTGQANVGTYRIVDARDVEIAGPEGPAVWQRK